MIFTKQNTRGMTLIELLVVLVITVAIFAGFGTILLATKKVITGSEGLMRANARADAIARVIRHDMKRISKSGFLSLRSGRLIFTLASPVQNQAYTHGGNPSRPTVLAAIVTYGHCQNANAIITPGDILIRRAEILDIDTAQTEGILNYDLSHCQILPLSNPAAMMDIDRMINHLLGRFPTIATDISIPPDNTMVSVNNLWQALTAGIQSLSIEWADAPPAGSNIIWQSTDATWTHHDQNNWPALIRFRFTITDPSMPDELNGSEYEVIVPIDQ